jgi:DNA-binding MarR family transcriptional regulator
MNHKDISRIAIKMIIAKNKIIEPMVDALNHHDLTECQYRALSSIQRSGSSTLSELAHNCSMLSESLSRIIPALKQRKLVDVNRKQDDRRAYQIKLSARGERLLLAVEETLKGLSFIDINHELEKHLDSINTGE